MSKNRIMLVICVVAALISAIGLYTTAKQVSAYHKLEHEKKVATAAAVQADKTYEARKKKIQQQATDEAQKSNDPLIKAVADHNGAYGVMNTLASAFFKQYYTWKSAEEYRARPSHLENIATTGLLKNQALFDDGKDSTGGDYIANTGVQSSFQSASAYADTDVSAIVKVNFRSWFEDEKENAINATRYYSMQIDPTTQKIKQLNLVFQPANMDEE
ncbi:hypothetical protein [Listeria booriae]|uniref:hypothetical protein n=1 Tax=Listeria booriae TaxID=1552123 RepID=UPI0016287B3B|nr:hypothetical protein [Listeria booriae]MBC2676281.1 conjugal transfer protein [Listeria booriae]MBC6151091.1 conjugal transfer protein [Listeria booriae]MBC6151160.1 conjugal transfer protein [Listeria booriae]